MSWSKAQDAGPWLELWAGRGAQWTLRAVLFSNHCAIPLSFLIWGNHVQLGFLSGGLPSLAAAERNHLCVPLGQGSLPGQSGTHLCHWLEKSFFSLD